MDDKGNIRRFTSDEMAKLAGFNIPLSDEEATRLESLPHDKRIARITQLRHEDRKQRPEKYPGQRTAHLVGANRAR